MRRYYREVLWVLADGRSGSAWLLELLNHKAEYRLMHQPFHPALVDGMGFLGGHQYVRPGDKYPTLLKQSAAVFSGQFFNARVDQGNPHFYFKRLLIRDIFAHLFAAWACDVFSEIKTLLLLRNPFAVAWSKAQKADWYWGGHPLEFLNQPYLYADHLQPLETELIALGEAADPVLQHLLNWCILHYVLMRDLPRSRVHCVFYEELIAAPEAQVEAVYAAYRPAALAESQLTQRELTSPARTAEQLPERPLRELFSQSQWEQAWTMLQLFGLETLYDAQGQPQPAQWEQVWENLYRDPLTVS